MPKRPQCCTRGPGVFPCSVEGYEHHQTYISISQADWTNMSTFWDLEQEWTNKASWVKKLTFLHNQERNLAHVPRSLVAFLGRRRWTNCTHGLAQKPNTRSSSYASCSMNDSKKTMAIHQELSAFGQVVDFGAPHKKLSPTSTEMSNNILPFVYPTWKNRTYFQ